MCARLGLVSLAYMWHQPQQVLLQSMIAAGVHALLVKVAAMGLQPGKHLGRSLQEVQSALQRLARCSPAAKSDAGRTRGPLSMGWAGRGTSECSVAADSLLHKMHCRSTRSFICGLLGHCATGQHNVQLQRCSPCCQQVTAAVLGSS